MEKYTNEIRNDYDLGLSLELITERFMASMLADGVKEIGKKNRLLQNSLQSSLRIYNGTR